MADFKILNSPSAAERLGYSARQVHTGKYTIGHPDRRDRHGARARLPGRPGAVRGQGFLPGKSLVLTAG